LLAWGGTKLTYPTHKAIVGSNIALIKYWGKRDSKLQWPANDSLSMTLGGTNTTTEISINDSSSDNIKLNGSVLKTSDSAYTKAVKHLNYLRAHLGFKRFLNVTSSNNFPSDCGIASSASGFGALTLAAIAAWTESSSIEELHQKEFSQERLAHLARMGSGSAGRSLMGGFVSWEAGMSPDTQKVSQFKSAEHWDLADIIVIVSKEKKIVGSTDAHKAAWTSLLFEPRLAGLTERTTLVKKAIEDKNLKELGDLIETEALEMHSVIMSADPAVTYMKGASSSLLAWIRKTRAAGNLPAYFTMDAGPNVHLICERKNAEAIAEAVKTNFNNFEIIIDVIGKGPVLSTNYNQDRKVDAWT
jgi:diphosphomevalonate decarboxylase